jgi:hypothetical protein
MLQLSGCDDEGEDGAGHGNEAGRRRSHEAPSIQGQPFAQIYHRAQVNLWHTIHSVHAGVQLACVNMFVRAELWSSVHMECTSQMLLDLLLPCCTLGMKTSDGSKQPR